MASEVDICNIALSHLGDSATVTSIDPPEGSAQATHCQRFYPVSRDSLQELHTWGFCTRREPLALLSNTVPEWQYVYAAPAGVLNYISILAADAPNDYSQDFPLAYTQQGIVNTGQGMYTPQQFAVETLSDGTEVIYTNQENATLRYTVSVTDPTLFSPLYVDALSHYLAAKLAGPVLKGEAGRGEAKAQLQLFASIMARATVSDANQRRVIVKQSTPWMQAR